MSKQVCFNGLKFTKCKKTGYYLCTRKVNKARPRLHRYIWEFYNGKIPEGYLVHHKDKDKDNNEISNFELMTNVKHVVYHALTAPESLREKRRTNVIQNAMPKAKKWHRSTKGKAWHQKQGKEVYDNMPELTLNCTHCGSVHTVKVINKDSRFCSNNCKSAWRRANHLDSEPRICEHCGKVFLVNKYSRTKCCSRSCGQAWSRVIKKAQGF